MKIFDTIAAISSPLGKGGVALLRISGSEALNIADRVFTPKSKKPLSECEHAKMVYGNIYERTATGETKCIDDGMAVVFRAPHSFTGEDTVEITCHGGRLITKCVLEAILAAGARPAEAGEFTRRAFLSGKLDLTEAEALGSLLEAENTNQLSLARNGMRGTLTNKTRALYEDLRAILGSVYASIDFPDEDLADMSSADMSALLEKTLEKTRALAATYRTGRAVNDGIKTVICGPANAGKSSVYNRLTGEESAIVTDIAGTTRDILRDTVTLGKTTLRIADTAGLRTTEDTVENIGIQKALAEIDSAELILAVFDSSCELTDDDKDLLARLKTLHAPTIILENKSDIGAPTKERVSDFERVIGVSAKSGEGFDTLAKAVDALFIDGDIDISSDAIVADARPYTSLLRGADALDRAIGAIQMGMSLDLCCIDIEDAMQSLGELEGREVGEDIVAEIFSKFCVGK